MASEKVTAMIEEIKALTVLELSELVHALEEEFGVSAAAMAAPAAGAAAPAAEEKTEFDVILAGFDGSGRGQGFRGGRPQGHQGGCLQGRGRGAEEEAGGVRRQGGAEVRASKTELAPPKSIPILLLILSLSEQC